MSKTDREIGLDAEVSFYRSRSLAESTKATYRSFRNTYLTFCRDMGYPAIPVTSLHLSRYIAFLAQRLSYNSIPKYLTVIRLMHLELGLSNPLEKNWVIDCLLKGIKRQLGCQVTKKLPMTPEIILQVKSVLDLASARDVVFWSACLTLFFGMFRISNVLVRDKHYVLGKHLARQDIQVGESGLVLIIRWSKTVQFREKCIKVPLPSIPNHPLCPTTAVLKALSLTYGAAIQGPAFVVPTPSGFRSLTPDSFVSRLKSVMYQLGYHSDSYSSHSFRRGAASWAFACGLPSEAIQVLGNWKSDCYKEYLSIPFSSRLSYAKRLTLSLP